MYHIVDIFSEAVHGHLVLWSHFFGIWWITVATSVDYFWLHFPRLAHGWWMVDFGGDERWLKTYHNEECTKYSRSTGLSINVQRCWWTSHPAAENLSMQGFTPSHKRLTGFRPSTLLVWYPGGHGVPQFRWFPRELLKVTRDIYILGAASNAQLHSWEAITKRAGPPKLHQINRISMGCKVSVPSCTVSHNVLPCPQTSATIATSIQQHEKAIVKHR